MSLVTGGTATKILGDTRLRGVVSGLEGSTVIEIDLGKLQQWTDGNPTQFPKGRGQAHPIGQTHPQSRPCWNQVARSSSSVEMP